MLLSACLAALVGCGQGGEGDSGDGATAAANEVVLTPEAAAEGRERMREATPGRTRRRARSS